MRVRQLGMDMMMALFLALGAVVYILLPLIADPLEKSDEAPAPQGNLIIELYWPDDIDSDIDLWAMAEADGMPVGYSNKGGPIFNLLRDDLGRTADISGRNQEIMYSRGIPDGLYVVNAHLFSPKGAKVPIPVKLIVAAKKDDASDYKQLFVVNAELLFYGHERTLARFVMKDGELVPDSYDSIDTPLRAARNAWGLQ